MKRLRFFATTLIGLEDIAAKEVEDLFRRGVKQDVGRIIFEGVVSNIPFKP